MLGLQLAAGNSAVADLLRRSVPTTTPGQRETVQRQPITKPHIIDIEETGHPEVEGATLPTSVDPESELVPLVDDDSGECRSVPLRQIRKSPLYVDNWQSLTARPDLLTLEVADVEFTYVNGRHLVFSLTSISHDRAQPAADYLQRGGLIWPRLSAGLLAADRENTPGIVMAAEWIYREIERRQAKRLELAELVVTFAGCVSALGGVASSDGASGGSRRGPPIFGSGGTRRGSPTGGGRARSRLSSSA